MNKDASMHKKPQKSNLSLDKNLKWREMFFSNTHWLQLTAPFYSIFFETSICQFNSSECSPIIPDEIREHLIRDQRPFLHPESLQVLQIHSFFSSVHSLIFYRVQVREHLTRDQRPFLHPESLQILQIHSFFSSVHLTHLLQGSGQRTPDKRSETIPSSRITPDPSDSQLLLFSSLTHLLQGSGQRTGMVIAEACFCAQWPIFVLFFRFVFGLIVRLEDPNMAHYKISNRVSNLLILYLLVFDRIHDAMCLNSMSRTSSRNIGTQHQKYSSIFHCKSCMANFFKPLAGKICYQILIYLKKDK